MRCHAYYAAKCLNLVDTPCLYDTILYYTISAPPKTSYVVVSPDITDKSYHAPFVLLCDDLWRELQKKLYAQTILPMTGKGEREKKKEKKTLRC